MKVTDKTKTEVKTSAKSQIGRMKGIYKHISKKGNTWYSVLLDGNQIFSLSEKQFLKHEQTFEELSAGQEVVIYYFSNIDTNQHEWRNIVGLSADFDAPEHLPVTYASNDELPF